MLLYGAEGYEKISTKAKVALGWCYQLTLPADTLGIISCLLTVFQIGELQVLISARLRCGMVEKIFLFLFSSISESCSILYMP